MEAAFPTPADGNRVDKGGSARRRIASKVVDGQSDDVRGQDAEGGRDFLPIGVMGTRIFDHHREGPFRPKDARKMIAYRFQYFFFVDIHRPRVDLG
jgi:hypothetical protein